MPRKPADPRRYLRAARSRLPPVTRRLTRSRPAPRFASFDAARDVVAARRRSGAVGLEIGGPSRLFSRRGPLPLYPLAERLDNCNFARATVWEGAIAEGRTFRYDRWRRRGHQYILEATDLSPIPAGSYDFVLSSHTLEHSANPLRALEEWVRVLKPGGGLVLVVPHKEGTFDHRRPVTPFEHLLADHRHDTREDDLTHLGEVLSLHDLSRDRRAGDRAAFEARTRRAAENRCLHHHVFDTALMVQIAAWAGVELVAVEPARPCHIVIVARKPLRSASPPNGQLTSETAPWRTNSPFALDRS